MPQLGAIGDELTLTVDFDRDDLSVFKAATDDERFLGALAIVAVGVGTVSVSKRNRVRAKKNYQDALNALGKARAAISKFSLMERMTLSNSIESLERIERNIANRLARASPNGNPVDVGVRYELHAIAQVFRRFGLPVKLTGDPNPSAFIAVACQLSAARGKRIAPDTMREHARAARLLSAPVEGESYSSETGVSGAVLGSGVLPLAFHEPRMNMRSRVLTTVGGLRFEFAFSPAVDISYEAASEGQPAQKERGDKPLD